MVKIREESAEEIRKRKRKGRKRQTEEIRGKRKWKRCMKVSKGRKKKEGNG